jgi:DNA polymerase-4
MIRYNIGATLTCSIGFAANRHLAKIASDTKKPDGLTIWYPEDVPGQLARLKLEDIPGIGRSMVKRLAAARVGDVSGLLALQPKQMRAIWRNVTGERLWYALHGYAVKAPETERKRFGHPPACQDRQNRPGAVRQSAAGPCGHPHRRNVPGGAARDHQGRQVRDRPGQGC